MGIGAKTSGKAKTAGTAPKRKRGTFVAFTVRCAAGEVRILLDEALSLLVPAAARGGAGSSPNGGGGSDDDEAGPGTGQRARGAMGPAGVDPSIGVAAELAAAAAAASTADASKGGGDGQSGGDGTVPPPAERTPLTSAQLRTMKDQRVGRLLRMVPVSLGVAESTIAFLCGGGEEAEEDESGEDAEEDDGRNRQCRWDELPIDTLQDLQKVQAMSVFTPAVLPFRRYGSWCDGHGGLFSAVRSLDLVMLCSESCRPWWVFSAACWISSRRSGDG
ncbi:unnamed protein product [Scytosiphon promiscuus]